MGGKMKRLSIAVVSLLLPFFATSAYGYEDAFLCGKATIKFEHNLTYYHAPLEGTMPDFIWDNCTDKMTEGVVTSMKIAEVKDEGEGVLALSDNGNGSLGLIARFNKKTRIGKNIKKGAIIFVEMSRKDGKFEPIGVYSEDFVWETEVGKAFNNALYEYNKENN